MALPQTGKLTFEVEKTYREFYPILSFDDFS